MFIKEDKQLKCQMCKRTVIQLITEGLPRRTIKQYPDGLCKDCKKKVIKQLRELFSWR